MVFIEIYTKDQCPLCETAKTMLKNKNIPFTEHVIGQDVTREQVLENFPGTRTAPIVVVDGVQIKEVKDFQLLMEA